MFIRRLLCCWITVNFVATLIIPPQKIYAQTVLNLPTPGTMVNLSHAYTPLLIEGLKVHPDNPLLFDFIMDTGNDTRFGGPNVIPANAGIQNQELLKTESQKLIKYFLATLTIPEKDLWVNLSPYEKDRMIPSELGQTEMGRDMLAQDYMLKQLTASLIYPEKDLGKEFWNRVYAKSQQLFGTTQIPVNTFNKVWILADKADVYVHNNTAFVVGTHLKVMLDEDYQSLQKHNKDMSSPNVLVGDLNKTHSISSQIIRQIILPEIEKEVNNGQNFSTLRQIFYSMILATWYKKNLKQALLNQVYADKKKTSSLSSSSDRDMSSQNNRNMSFPNASVGNPEYIYQQYIRAYKKGVFNYIKEDINQANQQRMPRKYFSGGVMDLTKFTKVVPGTEGFTGNGGSTLVIQAAMLGATPQASTPSAAMKAVTSSSTLTKLGMREYLRKLLFPAGIKTVYDLISKEASELTSIYGIKEGRIEEIRELLREHHFYFKGEESTNPDGTPDWNSPVEMLTSRKGADKLREEGKHTLEDLRDVSEAWLRKRGITFTRIKQALEDNGEYLEGSYATYTQDPSEIRKIDLADLDYGSAIVTQTIQGRDVIVRKIHSKRGDKNFVNLRIEAPGFKRTELVEIPKNAKIFIFNGLMMVQDGLFSKTFYVLQNDLSVQVPGYLVKESVGDSLTKDITIHDDGEVLVRGEFEIHRVKTLLFLSTRLAAGSRDIVIDMKRAVRYFFDHPISRAMTVVEKLHRIQAFLAQPEIIFGLLSLEKTDPATARMIVDEMIAAQNKGALYVPEIALRGTQSDKRKALVLIKEIRRAYPNAIIAAGSISNSDDSEAALEAGVNIVITPGNVLDENEIRKIRRAGSEVCLGIGSVKEALEAKAAGLTYVKAFPLRLKADKNDPIENIREELLKIYSGPIPAELRKFLELVEFSKEAPADAEEGTYANIIGFLESKPTEKKIFKLPLWGKELIEAVRHIYPGVTITATGGASEEDLRTLRAQEGINMAKSISTLREAQEISQLLLAEAASSGKPAGQLIAPDLLATMTASKVKRAILDGNYKIWEQNENGYILLVNGTTKVNLVTVQVGSQWLVQLSAPSGIFLEAYLNKKPETIKEAVENLVSVLEKIPGVQEAQRHQNYEAYTLTDNTGAQISVDETGLLYSYKVNGKEMLVDERGMPLMIDWSGRMTYLQATYQVPGTKRVRVANLKESTLLRKWPDSSGQVHGLHGPAIHPILLKRIKFKVEQSGVDGEGYSYITLTLESDRGPSPDLLNNVYTKALFVVTYKLKDGKITRKNSVTNLSDVVRPTTIAYHDFVQVDNRDEWKIYANATQRWPFDSVQKIPNGPPEDIVPGSEYDLRQGVSLSRLRDAEAYLTGFEPNTAGGLVEVKFVNDHTGQVLKYTFDPKKQPNAVLWIPVNNDVKNPGTSFLNKTISFQVQAAVPGALSFLRNARRLGKWQDVNTGLVNLQPRGHKGSIFETESTMSFGQEHVNQAMTTFWNVMTGAGFLLGFTALSFELNPFRFNFQNEEKPGVIIDTTMLYYRKKLPADIPKKDYFPGQIKLADGYSEEDFEGKGTTLVIRKNSMGGVLSVEASPSGSVFTNGILRARIQSIPSRIANLFESKYDEAMNAPDVHASKQPYDGGIDLNSRNMAMTVKGEKIDMRFDPAIEAQFKRGDFSGVRAVIVGITSIPSVLQLMNN